MASIYGTSQQYKPTQFVTSNKMLLKVGGVNNVTASEFLIQDVSIQFSRPVTPLFEIGTDNTYFAPGRAMGQMQIQRIIGSRRITDVLGTVGEGLWTTKVTDGDAEARTLTLTELVDSGATGEAVAATNVSTSGLTYIITGAIIESYGVVTNAQGMMIQESVGIRFSDLQFGGQDIVQSVAASASSAASAGQGFAKLV